MSAKPTRTFAEPGSGRWLNRRLGKSGYRLLTKLGVAIADRRSRSLRARIRRAWDGTVGETDSRMDRLLAEFAYLVEHAEHLKDNFKTLRTRRVLYAGQAYYNCWYLSRSIRKLGWRADLLNWDHNESSQIHYHGQDIYFSAGNPYDYERDLEFYLESLYKYDIFHFSNAWGITFGSPLRSILKDRFGDQAEIWLLKKLGKTIVYSNNGCLDGATRSGFASWGTEPVCDTCAWRNRPDVCGDERNSIWGEFRNQVADYQITIGGNRIDYNCGDTIHEVPEFYCLEKNLWSENLTIPSEFKLPETGTIFLFHSVANYEIRTDDSGVNIKSSHIYFPLVEKLRAEGQSVKIISTSNMPNKDVRYIQAQADIFLDMLGFGWFGATAREAMMLGKPVICYLRPEWLKSISEEMPEYVAELPIVSATPDTIESVLRRLIASPELRQEIGRKSRAFAVKWHDSAVAATRLAHIYDRLLQAGR